MACVTEPPDNGVTAHSGSQPMLVRGGRLYDGAGSAPRCADLLITDGLVERIAAPGEFDGLDDRQTMIIDADDRIVSPGFVDLHTHSDLTLLSAPNAPSRIGQGITTEVVGNCGLGVAPLPADADHGAIREAVGHLDLDRSVRWTWQDVTGHLQAIAAAGPAVNVATLVGHLPLHAGVAGFGIERPAGALDRMCGLLADALDSGAAGLSTGLVYAPLTTVHEDELLSLAEVVAERDKVFAWHVRSYEDDLVPSVDQAVRVAERTGVRTQISHLTAIGRRNWPSLARVLERIDQARAATGPRRIGIDVYPYLHGNCPLAQLLPAWAQLGTAAQWSARLHLPEVRQRVIEAWVHRTLGWDEVMISFVPEGGTSAFVGRTVAEIATTMGRGGDEVALDLLADHAGAVLIVAGGRSEELLQTVLAHPATVIGSDGQSMDPDGPTGRGSPHPRSYGCFPRYLAGVIAAAPADEAALAEAIARCTSRPAAIMGLDRGQLVEGAPADVLVWDPAHLADTATFDAPQQPAAGIDAVVVNGVLAARGGGLTGQRSGQVLRVGDTPQTIDRPHLLEEIA
ncbi:N-acyl-D-amino-acid deacylase family protein [Propionibacteriaceae bacterium Y1700]|uniref:N-acyl-D-amino-acid deacylase family protein n=1 Tax=Microlunatus sp. Y1700 TaxID=3418487 RepID=UPI003DA7868E